MAAPDEGHHHLPAIENWTIFERMQRRTHRTHASEDNQTGAGRAETRLSVDPSSISFFYKLQIEFMVIAATHTVGDGLNIAPSIPSHRKLSYIRFELPANHLQRGDSKLES